MTLNPYDAFSALDVQAQKNYQKKYKENRIFASKNNPSVNFMILDDQPTVRFEHKLIFGQNDFNNYYTCPKSFNPDAECPLCRDFEPRPIGFFTIFDLTKWEKDGKTHAITKKLYAFGKQDNEFLKKIVPQFGGSLKGVILSLTRGEKYTNVHLPEYTKLIKLTPEQMMGYVTREGLKPDYLQPYNYNDVLALDSIGDMRSALDRALVFKNQPKNKNQGFDPLASFTGGYAPPSQQYGQQNQSYGGAPSQQYAPPPSGQYDEPFGAPQGMPDYGDAFGGGQSQAPANAQPVYQQPAQAPANAVPTFPQNYGAGPATAPANAQPVNPAPSSLEDIPF